MTHIKQRRDTAANWTAVNPVLMEGEAGHEVGTGKWKLGDGVTPWNALPYKLGVDSVAGKVGAVTLDIADVAGAAPLASPAFSGSPTAPTPALADNDTSVATTAFVKAALAALVDSSPATLDTLNELAAALGDDPNFAATMAASLALKAPLASPVFTGNPTAPTPATADNDTSIATTAFVKAAIAYLADSSVGNVSLSPSIGAGTSVTLVRRGLLGLLTFDLVAASALVPPQEVFILPNGFRPVHQVRTVGINYNTTAPCLMTVKTNGQVVVENAASAGHAIYGSVVFPIL